GRLCPIETPEGPNIGLISSLCVFAKINNLGFIETPYREVKKGKVNLEEDGVFYLTAEEEENKVIAQANKEIYEPDCNEKIKARHDGDFPMVEPEKLDLIDVAPNQIASIAASLIPFVENDDANRALMGSNMMRQAVPLLNPQAPIVGTGIERRVAEDSRVMITAEKDGVVEYVDADEIVIRYNFTEEEKFVSFSDETERYKLPKFQKTNQSTCLNLRPIVKKGDKVKKGEILTEGYATENGELALGRNLKVAFMPWKGYNFEDAIVLSEKVVKEDVLTSIHVDEYSLEVRDTKRGMEIFTDDIPNVSEEATKNLDENGLISIGTVVNPGDILIGKITPKGESDPSPEEKLLRAIFGDKAGDVKDASLKAPPSLQGGVVVKKRLYKLFRFIKGKTSQGVKNYIGEDVISKGIKFTLQLISSIDFLNVSPNRWTTDKNKNLIIKKLLNNYIITHKKINAKYKRMQYNETIGDELPIGIIQLAKIFIAKKRKIKVGDKMAGRHGNKGIVAKIVREADMPFLEDGSSVDIVLNPLGVPSRMNLGQIYETVLAWAGEKLGVKFATPIFDGATLEEINKYSKEAGLLNYGKTYLYDGGTGERFHQPATVGIIYMLKLGHMVDDKMHSRSIGPYSLITQQPLGGKAQFGGQRFGEMEVWALEAFGAANILQEILTIKSEAIVKGEYMPKAGIPESLNVLLHELKGLCLNINLE
ncbi:MAG: DNA-directed RNA polymerase subunit beta, partial [Bacteroidetes bacterium 4572_128]